jgi:hypothetical protein
VALYYAPSVCTGGNDCHMHSHVKRTIHSMHPPSTQCACARLFCMHLHAVHPSHALPRLLPLLLFINHYRWYSQPLQPTAVLSACTIADLTG